MTGARPRRRQEERSAATTTALLEATIDAIAELGYQRATTMEICRRAGVTHGALFHHFDTRVELVIAALEHTTALRIARYEEHAAAVRSSAGEALDVLQVVAAMARDKVSVVWAEIAVAARTDPELRQQVVPSIEARWEAITAAAGEAPALQTMEPSRRASWLRMLRGALELAPLDVWRVGPAARDERRNRALLRLAEHHGAVAGGSRTTA